MGSWFEIDDFIMARNAETESRGLTGSKSYDLICQVWESFRKIESLLSAKSHSDFKIDDLSSIH
jgi:hypothetical protein